MANKKKDRNSENEPIDSDAKSESVEEPDADEPRSDEVETPDESDNSETDVTGVMEKSPVDVTGELVFSDEALAAIAQHAIDETEGIGLAARQPTGILSRFTRQKSTIPQLRLKNKTSRYVAFDIDVWINYGMPVTKVSEQLQRSVSEQLQKIAGLTGVVNVRVRGLV